MKGKLSKLSDEEFVNLVNTCDSFSDVKRKLGYLSTSGGVAVLIKKRIEKLKIDISNFTRNKEKRIKNLKRESFNLTDILVENSVYTNRARLKLRLIAEGLLNNECEKCKNIGEWCGEKLSLQLDHINGINNDNRLENLRFLCPNCHSQTNTFSGKNIRNISKMEK